MKSPFLKVEDWLSFYDYHIKNGGDDFYGMIALSYNEPFMVKLGYYDKYKGKCPVAEEVQRRCMLFKTNYRTIEEAEKNINVLAKTIKQYQKG